jgi:hypothetical protein
VPGTVGHMEITPNPQRPELDNFDSSAPAANLTRTLAGILIGAVLSAGVLLGALWALDRADDPGSGTVVNETTSEFDAEKARVNLWFSSSVPAISSTIELFRNLTPDDVADTKKFALLCADLDERITELEAVTEAPLPALNTIFRDWIKTLNTAQAACAAGDKEEFEVQLGISDADFRRFDSAITPYIPEAPNTPPPAPENS